MAVSETVPTLETIYLCDLDISKAEALKKEFEGTCKATIIPSTDTEGCIKKSELIITQTTASKPFLKADWVNKGATVIQMASNEVELDVLRNSDQIFVDYWKQMITNTGKAVTQLYNAGEIKFEDVVELAQLTLGQHPGRKSADETLFCSSMGLGALDIMIGYSMYLNAKKMGLGVTLHQWDNPLWE